MKASLLILFCLLITLGSCSEYQKVLKSEDQAAKYAFADSLYKKGKYKKALPLIEQLVPLYRGKPQGEKLMYLYASTYYNLEDYYLAGYQYERFETSYPKSDSAQTASFKAAKSYYQLSPRFSLDQKETKKALDNLQEFINRYPNSEDRVEANTLVAELTGKLEKKQFEVAQQYLHIEDYKAAINAFENFITDNPGSSYRKDAFYKRFVAAYYLSIKSFPSLQRERFTTAKDYYKSFLRYYEDTPDRAKGDIIIEDINKRLELLPTS